MPLKTRQQVREEFDQKGLSISAWARLRGYSSVMVISILNDDPQKPRYACVRGDAHNIAVELGLKHGEVCRANTHPRKLTAAA